MKNSYVISKHDGLTYQVTSDTVQTRNRRSVKSTTIRNVKHTQFAADQLVMVTPFEAHLCMAAEKIIRGKKAMSETESTVVWLSRMLKKNILA